MKTTKLLTAAALLAALSGPVLGQQNQFWNKAEESRIPALGTRLILPTKYETLFLNAEEMRTALNAAKREDDPGYVPVYITLPKAGGQFSVYRVFENTTMDLELAAKFPSIRSYDGVSNDGSGEIVKLDMTAQGFHAMIIQPGKTTWFIDPYRHLGDQHYYIMYSKADYVSNNSFECHLESPLTEMKGGEEVTVKSFGSCEKRTYRLAVSATGEYTAFHGGTVLQAQSAQVTTINRVNSVYMIDFAITMTLIADNNELIFTNAGTDPFSNGNPGAMIMQNQTAINNAVGSSGYDIGHVFGTDSGGLAGLGVVCSSQKARGVTGSSAPIGDAFDIDYVAHEIGHQFGGPHTFRGSAGACNGNENGPTAMEPGSGSTIMAYAGICDGMNVQSNSDAYFHGISLQNIGGFITNASHTCPVVTAIPDQSSPVVTGTSGNITIPANTPFALTASATDPDGDVLTYCWEQMNNQNSTQPPVATSTGGPNFRSVTPTVNPTRYFPSIDNLTTNGPFTYERLPSVNRTMNFRVAVRDNEANGGCNDHEDITVTTTTTSGPFILNYPSDFGIVWPALETRTVTWEVANTTAAPVACALVDIILSIDGGLTFTTVLSDTPNDGTQDITVPDMPTEDAILMVQCANGTFFDVSNNLFTIVGSADCVNSDIPTISGATTVCVGESTTLTVIAGSLNDATEWQWFSGSCEGPMVAAGNSYTVTTPGFYFVRGGGGCVTSGTCLGINVIQTNVNVTTTQTSTVLTANSTGSEYQWLDCNNSFAEVAGATGQEFMPAGELGSYAVEVITNGCIDTSACLTFDIVGLDELNLANIQLFPNPTDGKISVALGKSYSNLSYTITDVSGRIIRLANDITAEIIEVDLTAESKGVYFMNLTTGTGTETVRMVRK